VGEQPWVVEQVEEGIVEIPGFQGGQPQSRDGRLPQQSPDQPEQAVPVPLIVTVGSQMDPGEHGFAVSGGFQFRTSWITESGVRLAPAPRATVTMQKVQRLSQPSWTLRKGPSAVAIGGNPEDR
jgi:hypothetical protein